MSSKPELNPESAAISLIGSFSYIPEILAAPLRMFDLRTRASSFSIAEAKIGMCFNPIFLLTIFT